MSPAANDIFEFGPFRLDSQRRVLERQGEVLPLTSKVLDTLLVLVRNRDRVLAKDELMTTLWPDTFVEEANLAQNVSALRKALGESPGENRYIATVPGRGYRFVAEVRVPADTVTGEEVVLERHTRAQVVIQESEETSPAPRPWVRPAAAVIVIALAAGSLWVAARVRRDPAQPPARSLAILPFHPLAAGPDADQLALGLTDAVITRLSNLRQLIVRPTSSVLPFAAATADLGGAGRALAVESVLEGKVQISGDRIRVTVQLVRVADGRPIWADKFDENSTSIFLVEDSISAKVAQALAVQLAGSEKKQMARHYTEDLAAYRDYVEGRFYEFQFTRPGLYKAIDAFNRAIARDPGYGLAYSGLADAYTTASDWVLPPREALSKAEAAARRALASDDDLAEAHAALGHALMHQWKLAEAGPEFDRALRSNPNNTFIYFVYAEYLAALGRHDEALAAMRRALAIDPLSAEINAFLPWILYVRRDYESMLSASQKAAGMYPEFWLAHVNLGWSDVRVGRFQEAIGAFERARVLNPDSTLLYGGLAEAYIHTGRRGDALALLAELEKRRTTRYVSPMDFATTYLALGEKDRVFEWFDKAYADQSEMLLFLKYDPTYDALRADPRFDKLVRRIMP